MDVIVTGGTGFIGQYLVKRLEHDGIKFISLGRTDGDIAKKETWKQLPPTQSVIHLAGRCYVPDSWENTGDFIETNILGTFILLKSSLNYYNNLNQKEKNKFKFLHISTDEVYGSLELTGKFKETTAYNPSSPYSASKAASDHLVKSWFHTFGLPILITNCSNNYGPYQFPEKLIPLIITNCLESKPLPIYGTGSNIRDWIYVDDHCNAIYKILKDGKLGETYNIGGNQEITNLEIVEKICNILDKINPSTNLNKHTHKNPRENWKMMLELPEPLVTPRQRIAIQEYLNTKKNSAEETTAYTKLRNMFDLPPHVL